MFPVSLLYKNKIQELNRTFDINIKIYHSSGLLELSDEDLVVGSLFYTESSQASEEFTVGGTVASDIEFTIFKKPEYENIVFTGARVEVNVGLLVKDTVDFIFLQPSQPNLIKNNEVAWEYVPLGVFYIDEPDRLRNTIHIKAIDSIIRLEKEYSLSQISYPTTLYQIYVNICSDNGIPVVNLDFPNSGYMVDKRPEGELSYRDVLGYVAEASGTFARCNRLGGLELVWYEETDTIIEPMNRFDLKMKDDVVQITGVSVETEEQVYLTGTDKYVVDLSENQLIKGEYEDLLPNILTNIGSVAFKPYECEWQGNPALQAGDLIQHLDVDGNTHNTLITSMKYKYRGKSSMKASGLSELSRGFKGSTDKRLSEIKKAIGSGVDDKLTNLEQAVLEATNLLNNAMGGHVLKREGELLIMDTDDVETAQKVWKWNINGLGYSSNGVNGIYETAITMDGSINAKFITTGILNAGMVKTGILESEDGSTWINMDNGEFNFKNKLKFVDNVFTLEVSEEDLGIDVSDLKNYNVILSNESQAFPTKADGSTYSPITITSNIDTFKGANKIVATIGIPTLKNSSGQVMTGGTITFNNPTLLNSGHVTWTIPENTNLAFDSGWIEFPVTMEDITVTKKVTWSKAKSGSDGSEGDKGQDGTSQYVWVRYSNNSNGIGFDDNPIGKKYIGIAITTNNVAPSNYQSYSWSLIKGVDGVSSYTWIRYSQNASGNPMTPTSTNAKYIGIVVTESDTAPTSYLAYSWSLIKGQDGYTPVKGSDYFDGIDGQDGQNSYVWVRYSNNSNGNPFNTDPSGKSYVGIATTTLPNAPSNYNSYTWSLIKGIDGIRGEDGTNGQTSYLHIKYSNNGGITFTGNNGEDVGSWIGTYVDYIKEDSNDKGKYTWNKVKGEDARMVHITPSHTYFIKKLVGENYVINPTQITLLPDFQNCTYSKWEYSTNGTSWTSITRTTTSTTLPFMNINTRVLTIPKDWTIIKNNDYVVFKVTSTTGETDVQTLNILYDVGELETRVSSAEQKITPTAITNTVKDAITSGAIDVVTTSEVTQTMDSWVAKFDYLKSSTPPFRYVRSSQRGIGSNIDGLAGWYELEVIDENNVNVALGKTVTSNKTPIDGTLSLYTDGGKYGMSYVTFGAVTVGQYTWVKVDLGKIYSNIDTIIDYCAFALIYSYQYKLEVSEDNINWFTLFDGIKSGENIHTFNTKGGFQQGITTINADGVRVEHSGADGQYSEMRADGFIRKWQYGEAGYLNDIYVETYGVWDGQVRDIKPEPYRIDLPVTMRGRGDKVKIFLTPENTGAFLGLYGSEESFVSWTYSVLKIIGSDFNASPPYVDVEAYYNSLMLSPRGNRYTNMSFLLIAIGI